MSEQKKNSLDLQEPSVRARDSQGSPVTILAIGLAGGIGYFAWKLWKQRRSHADDKDASRTDAVRDEAPASRSKSKGSAFSFDRQPKSGASTSGRQEPSSSTSARKPSRSDPKPKSQKQLRKEAKQAKKAAREQAARDAENAAVASAIEKRAREAGLGKQPPEPQKQYYVDYDGVSKGYDKIVEWQQTGKKKF